MATDTTPAGSTMLAEETKTKDNVNLPESNVTLATDTASAPVGDGSLDDLATLRRRIACFITVFFPVLTILAILGAVALFFCVGTDRFADEVIEKMALAASIQVGFGMVIGYVCIFLGLMMTWFGVVDSGYTMRTRAKAGSAAGEVSLKSASPGLLFALAGAVLVAVCLYKPLYYQDSGKPLVLDRDTATDKEAEVKPNPPPPLSNTKDNVTGMALPASLMSAAHLAAMATGQTPDFPTALKHPIQFYTNGETIDAWTRNEEKELRSSFWFVRRNNDKLEYRQHVVVIYDRQPDKAYYFDTEKRIFIGRIDLASGMYSLLPKEWRKPRIEDIDPAAFPVPARLPKIGDMFDEEEVGLYEQYLLPPPATREYPFLEKSVWDSWYVPYQGDRIRTTIRFDGQNGTYPVTVEGRAVEGKLSEVKYELRGNKYVIRGHWTLGDYGGPFQFEIELSQMDKFHGHWTMDGLDVREWTGTRTRDVR